MNKPEDSPLNLDSPGIQEFANSINIQNPEVEGSLPVGQDSSYDDRVIFSWQGILPPPNVLAGYDNAVENGAERLFSLIEKEQDNRIANEKADRENVSAIVKGNEFRMNIGQWTASILAVVVVSTSIGLVIARRYIESVGLMGASVAVMRVLKQDGRNINDSESSPDP